MLLVVPALAQLATQRATGELPQSVRAALGGIQDFAFNFDQPGFYAVAEFVRNSPRAPGFAETSTEIRDWRDLLERPSEFRGHPVTVTGAVGRNKSPFTLESRPELGELWQLELVRDDQPFACTVILTGGSEDIPVGASVTVTGYFVMIRQYLGASHRAQPAALIVASGPTAVWRAMPRSATRLDWRWLAAVCLAGLISAGVLLRRAGRAMPQDVRSLRSQRDAPVSLADDLAQWAGQERHDDH